MQIIPFDSHKDQLKRQLELLQEELARLDAREPQDEESEEYEAWAEEHEDLEDRIDDVLDELN